MENYSVSIIESARRDLNDIFYYIAYEIGVPEAALDTIEAIEKAILSLGHMPYRFPLVAETTFAVLAYRMMVVKNYLVFYFVDDDEKNVSVDHVLYNQARLDASTVMEKARNAGFLYGKIKEAMTMRECTAENLRVYVHDTRDAMGAAAAADAAARLRGILREKELATVVFAAAPSQNEMLRALRAEDLPWGRIVALHMDEYIGLPPGAPQRFASFLQDAMWRGLPLRAVYEMGALADADAECARYAAILRDNPPDLILCGVGENGHLAFNDPWVADFEDPTDVKAVELDEVCRRQQVNDGCFPALADVPTRAITLTLPVFARAPQIVCVVPAASKAEAVYHAVHSPISTEHPCTMLRRHPNAVLYCDKDSGGRLVTIE